MNCWVFSSALWMKNVAQSVWKIGWLLVWSVKWMFRWSKAQVLKFSIFAVQCSMPFGPFWLRLILHIQFIWGAFRRSISISCVYALIFVFITAPSRLYTHVSCTFTIFHLLFICVCYYYLNLICFIIIVSIATDHVDDDCLHARASYLWVLYALFSCSFA